MTRIYVYPDLVFLYSLSLISSVIIVVAVHRLYFYVLRRWSMWDCKDHLPDFYSQPSDPANILRKHLATDQLCHHVLIAIKGTRPDGAWFFSDKHYAGSHAIKLYSECLKNAIHESNQTSSDIRGCFLRKEGVKINESLPGIRDDFVASGTPSNLRGMLRIPSRVQNGNPVTHIKRDPTTGIEDVMVNINVSNMDDFFFEGISEGSCDMVKLKTLIKFIPVKNSQPACKNNQIMSLRFLETMRGIGD